MKYVSKVFTLLLLAVLPFSLIAQNPTVVLEYMKVTQESENTYLEVEQAWKKIHQKRIDKGLVEGWQLWRNVYAGYNDPYQYITINWYDDYAQALQGAPAGFYEEMMAGEDAEIFNKTSSSRILASKEVSHQVLTANNNTEGELIMVNRMMVRPGMESAYVDLENDIFKPLHEEAIRRGLRTHWGVWTTWPYKEGQARYTTVDGYRNAEQLTAVGENYRSEVHPDLDWEEVTVKVNKTRKMVSTELWELVYFVMPE